MIDERKGTAAQGALFRDQDEPSSLALLEIVPKCTLDLLGDVGRDLAPSASGTVAGWLVRRAAKLRRDAPCYRNAERVLITVPASEDHGHVMI